MLLMKRMVGKVTPIGLDIGFGGARAVQLRLSGTAREVLHASRAERPVREDDSPGEPERLIRACMGQAEFSGRQIVTAISSPDAEFQPLDVPDAILARGGTSAEQVARSEMLRLIGQPEDKVETGYWSLPSTDVSAPNVIGHGCLSRSDQPDDGRVPPGETPVPLHRCVRDGAVPVRVPAAQVGG